MRYKLTVAAGYAAVLGWLSYYPDNVAEWVWYDLVFVAPFLAGLVAGPWAALALPIAVLIALPAGYASEEAEIPIWVAMMFMSLVALPAIVVGWAARWFVARYATR